MMIELWMRKREMGDGDENDMEDTVTARRNKMQDRLHSLGNPRRCAGIRDNH